MRFCPHLPEKELSMTTAVDTVLALIAACNRRDVDEAVALFSEDALYHNIPLEAVRGPAAIRAALGPFLLAAEEVDWVIHHIAATPRGAVLTERTDCFRLASGWLELPVMGAFEVRNGKIDAWRDYFDMAPLRPLFGSV
jgi:limonene-1,2-epoxide hydrolase